MENKSVSFRAPLIGSAVDLLGTVDLACSNTAKLIAALVSQLAAYTEEGVPLAPAVYLCDSISELVQLSGAGEYVVLSSEIDFDGAAAKILKAAAPLCGEGWKIFVERVQTGSKCRFGVFCGSTDPSALTTEEVVLDGYRERSPIIRVIQSAVNRVEVRANSGGVVEFRFNDDDNHLLVNADAKVLSFARAASGQDSNLHGYLGRLLSRALLRSHGALLAVVARGGNEIPSALRDSIILSPPLDLAERLRAHIDEGKSAASVSRLQVASELVCGLVGSDGVTLFDTDGRVLAYRCFVAGGSTGGAVTGGARTRAYKALVDMCGSELDAALFRSQDGRTEVKVVAGGG